MKKRIAAALLLFAVLFSGCTKIDYSALPPPETAADTEEPIFTHDETVLHGGAGSDETVYGDKYKEVPPVLEYSAFSETLQLEDVCDNALHNGFTGYKGDGYIQLDKYESGVFKVTVPTSQYYKLTVTMCAFSTGLDIITGGTGAQYDEDGELQTMDGASKGVIYIEDVTGFSPFTVDGIYLSEGENTITLQSVSGTAYADMVTIENGKTFTDYSMRSLPADPEASDEAVALMDYFTGIYGRKTLTGQSVTPCTNAEIAAIYEETGRLPAIRHSDLVFLHEESAHYDENMTDLQLAKEWSRLGGIVSYGWTWYSPCEISGVYSELTDFDITAAYTEEDTALLSSEETAALYEEGTISEELYGLICDIDMAAEALKKLSDTAVLFQPLADPQSGVWWGSADEYKWLWRLMFDRMTSYHGLHNLIWVWSGGSAEFYPGDQYIDIIGTSLMNVSLDSGNAQLESAFLYSAQPRASAISGCVKVPDPDIQVRDDARWLWFTANGGKSFIDEEGRLTQELTSNEQLDKAYNHEAFLTLDELPFADIG